MAKCYVYIIKFCNGKNYPIKIGVADNPEKRLSELQTGSPYGLALISKVEMPSRQTAYDLECWLHKRFKSARMSGGGVYNDKGELVGVNVGFSLVATKKDGEKTNMPTIFQSLNAVKDWVKEITGIEV